MFLGLSLLILGLAAASLPAELRQQHGVFLFSATWIAICLGIIAAFIVLLPTYDPSWKVASDRFAYEQVYQRAVDGQSPDFEIGFSLITEFLATLTANSSAYFLMLFLASVALFHVLVSYLFRSGDWIVIYFCYFNYFLFFNGILNVMRQTLGAALCCVAIVYFLKDRLRISCLLIVLASLIHSACILSLAIFLARVPGATVWRLVCAVFVVFAMSRAGVNQLVFDGLINVTGIDPKNLLEYTSGLWAWREYTGGIYRIDFLAFSLSPLVPYAFYAWRGDVHRSRARWEFYKKLTKTHVALVIPFAFFSYMAFSERFALQSWLFLPIMLTWPLLYLEEAQSRMTWAIQVGFLSLVAIVPNVLAYHATLMRICIEIL